MCPLLGISGHAVCKSWRCLQIFAEPDEPHKLDSASLTADRPCKPGSVDALERSFRKAVARGEDFDRFGRGNCKWLAFMFAIYVLLIRTLCKAFGGSSINVVRVPRLYQEKEFDMSQQKQQSGPQSPVSKPVIKPVTNPPTGPAPRKGSSPVSGQSQPTTKAGKP